MYNRTTQHGRLYIKVIALQNQRIAQNSTAGEVESQTPSKTLRKLGSCGPSEQVVQHQTVLYAFTTKKTRLLLKSSETRRVSQHMWLRKATSFCKRAEKRRVSQHTVCDSDRQRATGTKTCDGCGRSDRVGCSEADPTNIVSLGSGLRPDWRPIMNAAIIPWSS